MCSFKAFEISSTFKFTKCLDRLDFIIDRWFFFNSHHFQNFINVLIITTQYFSLLASSNVAHLLGAFGLLNFAMISHCWALIKRVISGYIHFLLRFIESKGLENDMSKVRTCQLSAHQWFRLKVRT